MTSFEKVVITDAATERDPVGGPLCLCLPHPPTAAAPQETAGVHHGGGREGCGHLPQAQAWFPGLILTRKP